MKRLFLYLFLILFTLQIPSQADDIRDFEIEGMSIGDSALDYFSEEEIKKVKIFIFKSKDYFSAQIYNDSKFVLYDAVQFFFKEKDKKYKIYSIYGVTYFRSNIEKCYPEKNKIVTEISNIFSKNIKKNDYTYKYSIDKSGKSKSTITSFRLEDGSIRVFCDDWSESIQKTRNWPDALKVSIETKEFLSWRSKTKAK